MKAEKIRLIITDVDGTMTDGKIYIGLEGEKVKAFNSRDGYGIKAAQAAGLKVGIITGRKSDIVLRRAAELKITTVKQGAKDKREAYAEIKAELGMEDEEIAYIGDDIADISVMKMAGLAAAVGDAAAEVQESADYIAHKKGGEGAVREVIEYILKAQGKWQEIMKQNGVGDRA